MHAVIYFRRVFVRVLVVLALGATGSFGQVPAAPASASASPAEKKNSTAPVNGDDYKPGPDSLPQAGVPQGSQFSFRMEDSKVFPGTSRAISVYVPAGYKGDKPACVYVGLDGLSFNVPVVFDNLIFKNAMPVTIAVGISPGNVASANAAENPRFDRSLEFDSLNDRLARFIEEEVLPEVEKRKTPGGLPILLSKDPNGRVIGGASTGGIGAFSVAWQHPDGFRRVFSAIGTFVGMRGGDGYPVLVRKTEPKPLRIFMQDGLNDEWGGGPEMGDWWMSNQTMQRALQFAGYQVEHVWGTGSHNGKHATAVFPDAMLWLWKDWPQPVKAQEPGNPVLKAILLSGEGWQAAATGESIAALASDPQGVVCFSDTAAHLIQTIDHDGKVAAHSINGISADGVAYGFDGRLYAADAEQGKIVAIDAKGVISLVCDGIQAKGLTVTNGGAIYATDEGDGTPESGKVWLIKPDGKKTEVAGGLKGPSGIALSPDGLWMFVAESRTHVGYSYRVEQDGTLTFKEPFFRFYVPDRADDSGAGGMCMDVEGRPYVATRMGVQVFDRNGRVTAVLPLPGNEEATSVCFGGAKFDTLFVTTVGKVYKRKMKTAGAPPWLAPFKLPPWGAG